MTDYGVAWRIRSESNRVLPISSLQSGIYLYGRHSVARWQNEPSGDVQRALLFRTLGHLVLVSGWCRCVVCFASNFSFSGGEKRRAGASASLGMWRDCTRDMRRRLERSGCEFRR